MVVCHWCLGVVLVRVGFVHWLGEFVSLCFCSVGFVLL